MVEIAIADPLPFVDVEHESTRAWLQDELPAVLADQGISDLDVAAIRGNDRLFTRAVAQHIYVANDGGEPRYSGIRYLSRHGEYECWAIFDGSDVRMASASQIGASDPDLIAVARTWGLSVHGTDR